MKKYDPLWELVGSKRPLLGIEEDVDSRCPVCHTVLHVGDAEEGMKAECGLCGAQLQVSREGEPHVELAPEEPLEEHQQVPADIQKPRGDMAEPLTEAP